jgi:type I restriction enzyme R subunit
MHAVSKRVLSESDICDQYITPAIVAAGWDITTQIRSEFGFTAGRIIVRGQLKHVDYLLFYQPQIRTNGTSTTIVTLRT